MSVTEEPTDGERTNWNSKPVFGNSSLLEENPKETGRLGVSFANPPEVPLDGTGFKEEAWDHKHKTPCAGPSQVSCPPVFYRVGWVTWEQPQTYFYTPV